MANINVSGEFPTLEDVESILKEKMVNYDVYPVTHQIGGPYVMVKKSSALGVAVLLQAKNKKLITRCYSPALWVRCLFGPLWVFVFLFSQRKALLQEVSDTVEGLYS